MWSSLGLPGPGGLMRPSPGGRERTGAYPAPYPTRPKSRRHAAVGLVSARLWAGENAAGVPLAQATLSWPSANSPCGPRFVQSDASKEILRSH